MKRSLSNSKIFRLLLPITLLLLSGLAAGCLPQNLRGPDPCNEGGTLLIDEFDNSKECGWLLFNGRGITEEITEDSLRISNSLPGEFAWANADRSFDDLIINVQARQVSGPDDNAYGVICRYQNEENFYVFLISGDGHYAIGKYQSGSPQVQYLTGEGQYVFSEAINQGAAQNDIRASCIGNELSLAVNGIPLETATDPTFVTGDIGLGASSFRPGSAVIEFDSIRVIAP